MLEGHALLQQTSQIGTGTATLIGGADMHKSEGGSVDAGPYLCPDLRSALYDLAAQQIAGQA